MERFPDEPGRQVRRVLRMRHAGAADHPVVRGVDRLPGAVNYLSGNNPDDWQTDLSTYGGVLYQAIYPGIDLRYDGAGGQLKSTYLVAPGADPGQIRRVYTGVDRIRVDSAGQLVVPLAAGAAAAQRRRDDAVARRRRQH